MKCSVSWLYPCQYPGCDAVLEFLRYYHWGETGTNKISLYYVLQLHVNLWLSENKKFNWKKWKIKASPSSFPLIHYLRFFCQEPFYIVNGRLQRTGGSARIRQYSPSPLPFPNEPTMEQAIRESKVFGSKPKFIVGRGETLRRRQFKAMTSESSWQQQRLPHAPLREARRVHV